MIKQLRRLWLKWFPKYESLETMFVGYETADRMIRHSQGRPQDQQGVICSRLEDNNRVLGAVWIERRRRITE
jgi:hypothetical protein